LGLPLSDVRRQAATGWTDPADTSRSNLAAALRLLSSGGFPNPTPSMLETAERGQATGRDRMGSPTLQNTSRSNLAAALSAAFQTLTTHPGHLSLDIDE
jgi:hypothetical protein